MALDFTTFLERYIGHRIRVRLNGYTTISGELVRLNSECMVLESTRFHGDDDGNEWYNRMAESDPDMLDAHSEGATIIKLSHISCVSCQSGEPIEIEAKELAAANGQSTWKSKSHGVESWADDDEDDGTIVVDDSEEDKAADTPSASAKTTNTDEVSYAPVDAITIELGWKLLHLADPNRGGTWMSDVSEIRKLVYEESGFPLPRVRLRDSSVVGVHEYRILIHGVPVSSFTLELGKNLVLLEDRDSRLAEADPGLVEPAFGGPCKWISPEEQDDWVTHRIVDGDTVWRTHLSETIKRHASELLTFESVQRMIDELKKHHPLTVNELIPHAVSLRTLFGVLQRFLKEQISIRNLYRILLATAEASTYRSSIEETYAAVRRECSADVCKAFISADHHMNVVMLDPSSEEWLSDYVCNHTWDDIGRQLVSEIQKECNSPHNGSKPLLVRNSNNRKIFWEICNSSGKHVAVIAADEIPRHIKIQPIALLRSLATTS